MVNMCPTSGLAFSEAMMGTRSATQVGGVGIMSSIQHGDGVSRSSTQGRGLGRGLGLGGVGPLGLCMAGDGGDLD